MVERLRAAGCVFAEEEAALLLAAGGDTEALVERRIAGEPLEIVLGWVDFAGHRLLVAPGVFVPRRRTELLARTAASLAPRLAVDLCCGVGAIGAYLAARTDADVHSADIDPVAADCARRNRAGEVHVGDLFAALPSHLRGRVDVLTANAPYVPSADVALMPREAREFEPLFTLDGGVDGLDLHRRIATGARDWLSPSGTVLIETSVAQAPRTAALLAAVGLEASVLRDENLDATVVRALLRGARGDEDAEPGHQTRHWERDSLLGICASGQPAGECE